MPLNVGTVEAVLAARDTMSPAFVAAAETVLKLQGAIKALGDSSIPELQGIGQSAAQLQQQLAAAEAEFQRLAQIQQQAAAAGAENVTVLNAQAQASAANTTALTAQIAAATGAAEANAAIATSSTAAAAGQAEVATASVAAGQSMTQVEGIATRLIERLLLLYAIRGTFNFVVSAFEAATELEKLHSQLGLSLDELQKIQYAAGRTDVDFKTMSTAVDHLDKTLAAMKITTSDALASIGLSFTQVFALQPDQRFDAIVAAIAKLPDQAARARVEVALLGSDAIDPLIVNYAKLADEAAKTNKILDDDTVNGLAQTAKAFKEVGSEVKDFASQVLYAGQTMTMFLTQGLFGADASRFKQFLIDMTIGGLPSAIANMNLAKPGLNVTTDIGLPTEGGAGAGGGPLRGQAFVNQLRGAGAKPLAPWQLDLLNQLNEMDALTANNAAQAADITSPQFERYKKDLAAAKKDAEERLKDQQHMDAELMKLDQEQTDLAVKDEDYMLKRIDQLDDEAFAKRERDTQTSIERTRKLWEDYALAIEKDSGSAYDYVAGKADKWYDDEKRALDELQIDNETYARNFEAIWARYTQMVGDAQVAAIKAVLQANDLAAEKTKTFLDMLPGIERGLSDIARVAPNAFKPFVNDLKVGIDSLGQIDKAYKVLTDDSSTMGQMLAAGFETALGVVGFMIPVFQAVHAANAWLAERPITHSGELPSLTQTYSNVTSIDQFMASVPGTTLLEKQNNLMKETGLSAERLAGILHEMLVAKDADAFNKALAEMNQALANNANTAEGLAQRIAEVFQAVEDGTLGVNQASAQLDSLFPQLAAAGTDAYGRISDSLREVIDLNDKYGLDSKAIADWRKTQGANALGGYGRAAQALIAVNMGENQAPPSAADLATAGTLEVSGFATAVATGTSKADAIKAESQSLTDLEQRYKDLGIEVTDVGLKQLFMMNDLQKANPALLDGVDGIMQGIVSMDNLGVETKAGFEAQEKAGFSMYTRLQAGVHALGGDTRDALLPMQDYLHVAADEAKKLGIPLDANTQMMIDQSEALGIWDANAKPVKSTTEKLADAIERLVNWLEKIPGTTNFKVSGTFDINGNPLPPNSETPLPGPREGMAEGGVIQGLAGGGRVLPFPLIRATASTDSTVVAATPGEGMVTVAGMGRIGAGGLTAINQGIYGGGGSSGGGNIQITMAPTIVIQKGDIEDADRVLQMIINEGMRDNRAFFRTRLQEIATKAAQAAA